MRFTVTYWLSIILLITFASHQSIGEETTPMCRHGDGLWLKPAQFKPYACCWCYHYIFMLIPGIQVGSAQCNLRTSMIEDTTASPPISYVASTNNSEAICAFSSSSVQSKCDEWLSCCESAIECCDEMSEEQQLPETVLPYSKTSNEFPSTIDVESPECPTTWDGLQCWSQSETSTPSQQTCPSIITKNVNDCVDPDIHYTFRECSEDGRWRKNLSKGMGESDYTKCTKPIDCYKNLKVGKFYAEIASEVVSLCAVIPAIIIFSMYRPLYSQPRIKIHINLFLAIVLHEVTNLIYTTIYRTPDVELTDDLASIECRVLHVLIKFSIVSMFFWMMMEGFYLHWLMVNTFNQPKLPLLILAGWGLPAIVSAIYATARATNSQANQGCWRHGHNLDLIYHITLILCLVLNIVFLANIMRVILTKLTAHQNEPSYYRRAVKATAILVPPFGLLLAFTVYAPEPDKHYKDKIIVDLAAAVPLHIQGLIISIILCYSNGEVLTNLRKTLSHYCTCVSASSQRITDGSMMTGVSHLSTARPSVTAETSLLTTSTPTQEEQLLVQKNLSYNDKESNNNKSSSEKYRSLSNGVGNGV